MMNQVNAFLLGCVYLAGDQLYFPGLFYLTGHPVFQTSTQ